jgi:hypothetical protein
MIGEYKFFNLGGQMYVPPLTFASFFAENTCGIYGKGLKPD